MMTSKHVYAAVGTDGMREVVWGVGVDRDAALQDCESQDIAQSCEVHEITEAQRAIVLAGDVSWPIRVAVQS